MLELAEIVGVEKLILTFSKEDYELAKPDKT